jgi:peptidoglycan-N-acetylglucosamine deacetylase
MILEHLRLMRTLSLRLLHTQKGYRAAVIWQLVAGVNWHAPEGTVAITFDDGPHPSSTPKILDVLRTSNATATFFCTGKNAQSYPDIVRRMIKEGHSVGCHSMSHADARTESSFDNLRSDHKQSIRALEEIIQSPIRLYRPPHGSLTFRTAWMLRRSGLQVWLWTVDPEDWRPTANVTPIVATVSASESGDVILLHDWIEEPESEEALDRAMTIQSLPLILERLNEKGLSLVSL